MSTDQKTEDLSNFASEKEMADLLSALNDDDRTVSITEATGEDESEPDVTMSETFDMSDSDNTNKPGVATGNEPKKGKSSRKPAQTYSSMSAKIKDKYGDNIALVIGRNEANEQAAYAQTLTSIDIAPVKIQRKAENVLAYLQGQSSLSVYVNLGIKHLLATPGGISVASLKEYLMDQNKNGVKSYSQSTAAPQSANIIRLMNLLEITTQHDKVSVKNPTSAIISKYVQDNGIRS